MRLLVIVNHFHPDRGGGGAVYTDMCAALVERGMEVTVYCPYPFYPEWKDKSGHNGLRFRRYRESGVDVVRFGLFIPHDPRSLWQRMLFEASLFLSLLRLVPSMRRFDAVMVFCPYFGMVVPAVLSRLAFQKPIWLNVQDIATTAALATGIVRSRLLARLLGATERFVFNCADVWSSISPVMIDRLKPLRRHGQPIVLLPNWADKDLMARFAAQPPTRLAGPHSPIRLLYAGNIGRKQNLLDFCRHLHESDAPFQFRIFGAGGAAEELKLWLAEVNDSRFSFGPFLDANQLANELLDADLYVITEQPGTGDSFFPSKLVTGLAAGTPILAVCDSSSPLGQEMREAVAGPHFDWTEIDRIPVFLTGLTRDTADLERWGSNGAARAARYNRDTIVNELTMNLERLARGQAVSVQDSPAPDSHCASDSAPSRLQGDATSP
jgi:colanic acid biosynthesis glycosyl transferase WcaI